MCLDAKANLVCLNQWFIFIYNTVPEPYNPKVHLVYCTLYELQCIFSQLHVVLSKMAARSDAAATPGPKNGVFMSVSLVSSSKIKAYLCETFSSDLDSRSNRYGNYYNDIVTVIVNSTFKIASYSPFN